MTRMAMMCTRGDPVTLSLPIESFKRVWYGEVDKLYVHVGTPVEDRVKKFIKKMLDDPKIYYTMEEDFESPYDYHKKVMFEHSSEDYIVTMEDDSAVFQPGAIDQAFRLIEDNIVDVIGTPVFATSPGMRTMLEKVYPGWTPRGPCFCFARRSDMQKTDHCFTPKQFDIGDVVPELGGKVTEYCACDTFLWMSIQLRAQGLKFLDRSENRGIELYVDSPWGHITYQGALFKEFLWYQYPGYGDLSLDTWASIKTRNYGMDTPLGLRTHPKRLRHFSENWENFANDWKSRGKEEWERLMAWTAADLECFSFSGIEYFIYAYKKAMDGFLTRAELNTPRFQSFKYQYKKMIEERILGKV